MTGNSKRIYFAYGSNMDLAQMGYRCPGTTVVGMGKVDGYQFIINSRGVATVIPEPSCLVYGVLWNLTGFDEKTLDGYEGVEWGTYEKIEMDVEAAASELAVSALVYVARDDTPGVPRDGYMEQIVAAAQLHRLPDPYVVELKSWLKEEA